MRSLAHRLKKSKYKKAKPFAPLPPLLKFLIVVLMVGVVSFSGLYGYWQNQYYGRGAYNLRDDPFTNVWNGQVGNYTLSTPVSFSSAVTGTIGFGTSVSPSSTSGGPSTGNDTGHLSFGSPVPTGAGILVYAYSQTVQSFFVNDTLQNVGPALNDFVAWPGNSTNGVGRLGLCWVSTSSGEPTGVSFLMKNNQSATGTVSAELYSTTGSQSLAGVSVGSGCAERSTLIASSANSVDMSTLGVSTPTLESFNFIPTNATVTKGLEYVAVAVMTFTNAPTKSLEFEFEGGTWFGISPQGPYCQQSWNGGFASPSYASCNYSNVSNGGRVGTNGVVSALPAGVAGNNAFSYVSGFADGVCFTAPISGSLTDVDFWLKSNSGPGALTGTMTVKIYSTTGAISNFPAAGSGCSKAAALVATSSTINANTLTASFAKTSFAFAGGSVASGLKYFAVLTWASGSGIMAFQNSDSTTSAKAHVDSFGGGSCNVVCDSSEYLCSSAGTCEAHNVLVSPVTSVSGNGPLSQANNDLNQYGCDGNAARRCVWLNVAVYPRNKVSLCVANCLSVSDSRGNSYSLGGCVSFNLLEDCVFEAINGNAGTVAWVDVASSVNQFYSALAVSYLRVDHFGPVLSNTTVCLSPCQTITLLSPRIDMRPSSIAVGSYSSYVVDVNGFFGSMFLPSQTERAVAGDNAGFGNQCDGYTPCSRPSVDEATSSQLYSTGGGQVPGHMLGTAGCNSGAGFCPLGMEEIGLWVTVNDNLCPSGWQCFNSGVHSNSGVFDGYFNLYSNPYADAVALSNDSYSLATAVSKPLSFVERMNGGINVKPWGWYLTVNGTLPSDPDYNPLSDPGVYLAFVAYPKPDPIVPAHSNGTINYYVYMRHSADQESLLAAGGGRQDTYPTCSPTSDVYLCGRKVSGDLGGLMSMLLNFTGGTEPTANCGPTYSCGASYFCVDNNSIVLGATTCNIVGNFNTGQVVSGLTNAGQVNFTRVFPWLNVQSQNFHTGFWSSRGEDTVNFVVKKWRASDPGCADTAPNPQFCRFNVFHLVFPNAGSCTLVQGQVPCDTQETGFIGWLGGLFSTAENFLGDQFPVIKPFFNIGNTLLGALASGVSQAFLLMASQLQSLLNEISLIWGDGHLGDNVFKLLQGTIATLNQILGGFGVFAIWIFNFVFIVVPFLIGNFVTLIVSVSASVYVIVLTLFPLLVAFGGIINMPLQSLFFFDYVFGLSEVLFFGLPGFVSWIRFNIWLFTLGWRTFDYFMSKTIWTIRSLKQLLPVVG